MRDLFFAESEVVLDFRNALSGLPTSTQHPCGDTLDRRGSEGYARVYDYRAVSPSYMPYQSEVLLVVELGEPLTYHLLPGDLTVRVSHNEVADRRIVIHFKQIQQCVVSFRKPFVLGERVLGAQHLGGIGSRPANPLEGYTKLTEGGDERDFDQFKIGEVLPLPAPRQCRSKPTATMVPMGNRLGGSA